MKALQISLENGSRLAVFMSIKGDIDKNTSLDVRKLLIALFNTDQKVIVVDLSEVNYIDSSGIATFVEGLQLSNRCKKRFKLICLKHDVKKVFEFDHLLTAFEIFDSSEDALKDLAPLISEYNSENEVLQAWART